jgi:anaerobic selenocysteine-containing dehydrogenase
MGVWHKTGCVLCAQNCGLEVFVENNRMMRVRPDRSNPRSQGYACRKGLNVIYHQYPADRLTQPLKRVGDRFENISWDRAADEIAEKMRRVSIVTARAVWRTWAAAPRGVTWKPDSALHF